MTADKCAETLANRVVLDEETKVALYEWMRVFTPSWLSDSCQVNYGKGWYRKNQRISVGNLTNHFYGNGEIAVVFQHDASTNILVVDLDDNPDAEPLKTRYKRVRRAFRDVPYLVSRTPGGGLHVTVIFDKPINAAYAGVWGRQRLLRKGQKIRDGVCEVFPKLSAQGASQFWKQKMAGGPRLSGTSAIRLPGGSKRWSFLDPETLEVSKTYDNLKDYLNAWNLHAMTEGADSSWPTGVQWPSVGKAPVSVTRNTDVSLEGILGIRARAGQSWEAVCEVGKLLWRHFRSKGPAIEAARQWADQGHVCERSSEALFKDVSRYITFLSQKSAQRRMLKDALEVADSRDGEALLQSQGIPTKKYGQLIRTLTTLKHKHIRSDGKIDGNKLRQTLRCAVPASQYKEVKSLFKDTEVRQAARAILGLALYANADSVTLGSRVLDELSSKRNRALWTHARDGLVQAGLLTPVAKGRMGICAAAWKLREDLVEAAKGLAGERKKRAEVGCQSALAGAGLRPPLSENPSTTYTPRRPRKPKLWAALDADKHDLIYGNGSLPDPYKVAKLLPKVARRNINSLASLLESHNRKDVDERISRCLDMLVSTRSYRVFYRELNTEARLADCAVEERVLQGSAVDEDFV